MAEETTLPIKIDSVILTPEVVDDFRLNYENPAEALGKDLVRTMQVDFADRIEKDPNFLTWDGITRGTATILDFIPSTAGKTPAERALSPDQAVVLFSNAEPATFARPFLSEFAKSVPATEVMAATARLAGPRIIPAATVALSPLGPGGAAVGFGLGVLGTGALSLFTGGAVYLAGDAVEEKIMGPDPVITPGQRAAYEAYRTLGGGAGAIRFPWMLSRNSNIAGNAMFQNIANEAGKSKATALATGLDNLISASGKAARNSPVLTGIGELASISGSAVGANLAESMAPGETIPRLGLELLGGNLLYSTVLKALPKIAASDPAEGVANVQQRALFKRINELYADYGTPEQYDTLIENLTGDEMKAALKESFPGVDFTAGQQGGDLLLMGVEAKKASDAPELNKARKKAERESLVFMNNFIKGLISNGDRESLKKAAEIRSSIFNDTLQNGLNVKMAKFLQANAKLADQPGQAAVRTKQELSEELYEMVGNYITAASNKERTLWGDVPTVDVIMPLGPDADPADLPNFLKMFDEISYEEAANQKSFKRAVPELFDFIENARRDLGIAQKAELSDPEIDTLAKYENVFDAAVAKLSGFEVEQELKAIMENANALPVGERAAYLRRIQPEIKRFGPSRDGDLDQNVAKGRLLRAIDTAADYMGVLAASENRATQRAVGEEAGDELVPLTSSRLSEVRSKLLRVARSLAADPATTDEATRIGRMAEAISQDLDVDGFGEVYDVARSYTRAKHDFFTRTIVGDVGASVRSGASKLPPEVTFETMIKSNPSVTLSRVRQFQGMAEFADSQGLTSFLSAKAVTPSETVFTTTSNLVDSFLRGLKEVASKEVFDVKTGKYKTVINAGKLEDWKKSNQNLLEVFPQLTIDLESAATAQRAVEVMDQNVKKARALEKEQGYLSKLIGGVSPTLAVANAFNSENPVRAFKNLFALRRMGSDKLGKKRMASAEVFELRASNAARSEESSKINDALQTAILEHSYLAAGGEGAFNPQVFYQTLFGKLPKDANQSLMKISDEFDIFPEKLQNRIKFMSEQMVRVQTADAAGKFDDPDFMASAGPLIDFYIGVLGSAAGSQAFAAVGGKGAGVISASNAGSRELRKFVLDLPQTAKLKAIDLILTDPQLTAAAMQRPGTDEGRSRASRKMVKILNEKLFDASGSMVPFIIREGFEEEDRGTGSPLAEDPRLEIPALQRRLENQNQQNLPPSGQQGSLNTVPEGPPALPGPVTQPSPVQQAAAPPQRAPVQSSGPVDRTRYAAMFPNDSTTQLIKSGIGSLGA